MVDELVFNELTRLNQRFIKEAIEMWDMSEGGYRYSFPEYISGVFNRKWWEYVRWN